MYYIYILHSEAIDKYYVGHSNDPWRRVVISILNQCYCVLHSSFMVVLDLRGIELAVLRNLK